jgi:hypothetical protein
MRYWISYVLLLFMFSSCGMQDPKENRDPDTALEQSITLPSDQNVNEYALLHTKLQPLRLPDWIDVDSVRHAMVEITPQQLGLLFPPDFGIPGDVRVHAFATLQTDSATNAICYRMQKEGTANKDIWVVLYDHIGKPVAIHCPATKGEDHGYAKIVAADSMREVFIDKGEKTIVRTKTVVMRNGRFVTSDEVTTTFGPGNDTDAKVQTLLENFWK